MLISEIDVHGLESSATIDAADVSRQRTLEVPSFTEAARDAFMRAGPEVETARSQTIDNLYGYIRAETERNEKLARLVRMKEVLKKKADLKLQDELDERRAGGFES